MSLPFAQRRDPYDEDAPAGARLSSIRYGTPGNDRFQGGGDFDMSQGGDDRLRLSGNPDTVYFGAAFTGADRVNGGKAFDTVTLDGDYSAWIDIQANSLVRIERLVLEGGPYVITGDLNYQDSFGNTVIDATQLLSSETLTFYARTSLGTITVGGGSGVNILDASGTAQDALFFGGASEDVLIGGSGTNTLIGLGGADTIHTNSDATIVRYVQQSDSIAQAFDTIHGFQGRIGLGFDSDTSDLDPQHDFHFGKTADRTGNILFKYDAASDETIVKVFTDADHKADFVLHLTGDVPLTPADFIFG